MCNDLTRILRRFETDCQYYHVHSPGKLVWVHSDNRRSAFAAKRYPSSLLSEVLRGKAKHLIEKKIHGLAEVVEHRVCYGHVRCLMIEGAPDFLIAITQMFPHAVIHLDILLRYIHQNMPRAMCLGIDGDLLFMFQEDS